MRLSSCCQRSPRADELLQPERAHAAALSVSRHAIGRAHEQPRFAVAATRGAGSGAVTPSQVSWSQVCDSRYGV